MLDLSRAEVVACGRSNFVYKHPGDPALLVKVRARGAHSRPHLSRFAWQRRVRDLYKALTSLSREVREYHRVGEPYPETLQQFRGLVTTTEGPGLLVGAEMEGSRLAPTLRELALAGSLSVQIRADLDAFFAWLFSSAIVVGDVHAGNLVYAGDREHKRFVLIDGLGDKTFVPLGAWHAGWRLARKRRIRTEIETELHALSMSVRRIKVEADASA